MGAITRSAAATVLASISILGAAATAGHQHSAPGPRATEIVGNPPVIIVCADSMVWDGHECVAVIVHP